MGGNLSRLALMFDNKKYQSISERMFLSFSKLVVDFPSSFGNWLSLMTDKISGTKEIAVVGSDYLKFTDEINSLFMPNKLIMAARTGDSDLPLLAGKEAGENTLIFLCENYSCKLPVDSLSRFKQLIELS